MLLLYLLSLSFRSSVFLQHKRLAFIFFLLLNHNILLDLLLNLFTLIAGRCHFLLILVVYWSFAVVVWFDVLIPDPFVYFAFVFNIEFGLFDRLFFHEFRLDCGFSILKNLILALCYSQGHWFLDFIIGRFLVSDFSRIWPSAFDLRSCIEVIMVIGMPGFLELFL
jgi:hypothetical protein